MNKPRQDCIPSENKTDLPPNNQGGPRHYVQRAAGETDGKDNSFDRHIA